MPADLREISIKYLQTQKVVVRNFRQFMFDDDHDQRVWKRRQDPHLKVLLQLKQLQSNLPWKEQNLPDMSIPVIPIWVITRLKALSPLKFDLVTKFFITFLADPHISLTVSFPIELNVWEIQLFSLSEKVLVIEIVCHLSQLQSFQMTKLNLFPLTWQLLYHIQWSLKAQPQRIASYGFSQNTITFQAGCHNSLRQFEKLVVN